MSLLVLEARHGVSLGACGKRIDAASFAALRQADELLRSAEDTAATTRAEGVAQVAARAVEAHECGYEQGRREGVAAVLGTLELQRRLTQLLASRIAEVVEQTVRNILGELEPVDLFRRRIKHLLQHRADTSSAVLHVAPAQLHLAHEIVDDLAAASGGELGWLSLLGDEACARDVLVLETRVGFVDASLELSLGAARELISRAVESAAMGQAV